MNVQARFAIEERARERRWSDLIPAICDVSVAEICSAARDFCGSSAIEALGQRGIAYSLWSPATSEQLRAGVSWTGRQPAAQHDLERA